MRSSVLGVMLAGASVLAFGAGASAQTSAASATTATQPGAPPAAAGDNTIGEVVVTAQRREERLQTVPIAVTALNSGQLEQAGIRDITRLEVLTPGLQVGETGSDSRPALRGVKTDNSRQAQADASVAFFVDGVYQAANQEALAGFVDVGRVEVARGPQGTLFGRNSFGGAISVFSNLPTREFGGSISAEGGNYGKNRFEGVLNVPVNDTLQFRFVALTDNSDGWVKNLSPTGSRAEDDQDTYLRGTARWKPNDKFDAILRTNYWSQGGHGGGAYEYKVGGVLVDPNMPFTASGGTNQTINGVPLAINPRAKTSDTPNCGNCAGLPSLANYPAGVPIPSNPWTINQDFPSTRRVEQYATSLELNYDLGFATLKSISAYNLFDAKRLSDSDFTEYALRTVLQNSHNETTTQEFQLASHETKPFQWVGGVYYLRTNAFEDFEQSGVTPAQAYRGGTYAVYDTNSYAGYAQASYNLTDQLRLTGGVRYTVDHKTASGHDGVSGADIGSFSKDFYRTTYRGAIDYQFTPSKLFYFSVSNGFRSGGFNVGVSPGHDLTFGPEDVTAYEVGAKTQWLDRRLQANVSVFHNDYSALQVVGLDENTFVTYTQNTGNATADGVEAEVIAIPIPKLNVTGTLAYLDARYDRFFANLDPVTNSAPYVGNGNRVAMSPKWRLGLAVDYTLDFQQYGRLTPRIQSRYSSSYYLLDYNTPIEFQDDYIRTDLRLTWTDPKDRYSVEAFVNNIENVPVKAGGEFGGRGAFFIGYEPPRLYGVTVGYKF